MTNDEVRRYRIGLLINEFGGLSKLAEVLEKSASQISQWHKGSPDSKSGKPRVMQDASAREIEARAGKPRGWLDTPPESTPPTPADLVFTGPQPVPEPPTIACLLDSLREQIAAQPEAVQLAIAGLVSNYLTANDPENGAKVADAIERLLAPRPPP